MCIFRVTIATALIHNISLDNREGAYFKLEMVLISDYVYFDQVSIK